MTNVITKEQLDSITPARVRTYKRIKAMLANLDVGNQHHMFMDLMRNGMAMRDMDYSYKAIERFMIERLG